MCRHGGTLEGSLELLDGCASVCLRLLVGLCDLCQLRAHRLAPPHLLRLGVRHPATPQKPPQTSTAAAAAPCTPLDSCCPGAHSCTPCAPITVPYCTPPLPVSMRCIAYSNLPYEESPACQSYSLVVLDCYTASALPVRCTHGEGTEAALRPTLRVPLAASVA